MKKRTSILVFILVMLLITSISGCTTTNDTSDTTNPSDATDTTNTAEITKLLDIPWRHQWLNDGGYCGETSIQCCALIFGTYISQDLARKYGGGEVIAGADVDPPYGNASAVYTKLKLTYNRWDYWAPEPQYKDYLNWVKNHLNQDHPVIFGVYLNDGDDPDFDHIIPAVGFTAESVDVYNDSDTLTFYDLFEPEQAYTRTFEELYDNRDMQGNGATYDNLLPKVCDYGDAITGIEDLNDETYPVKLAVDVNDEPNITEGSDPVNVNATITISELTPGNEYLLLRYNDYENIPNENFKEQSDLASSVVTFTANDTTTTLEDTFMSNTMAAYRCVSN